MTNIWLPKEQQHSIHLVNLNCVKANTGFSKGVLSLMQNVYIFYTILD